MRFLSALFTQQPDRAEQPLHWTDHPRGVVLGIIRLVLIALLGAGVMLAAMHVDILWKSETVPDPDALVPDIDVAIIVYSIGSLMSGLVAYALVPRGMLWYGYALFALGLAITVHVFFDSWNPIKLIGYWTLGLMACAFTFLPTYGVIPMWRWSRTSEPVRRSVWRNRRMPPPLTKP